MRNLLCQSAKTVLWCEYKRLVEGVKAVEVIVGIAILSGAIIVAFRFRQREDHDISSRPSTDRDSSTVPAPAQRKTPSSDDGRREPWRIQSVSATPIQQKRVLKGRAYVVDGDTIKLEKKNVRLFGIDAPELDHPYGKKAMWDLRKICAGQTITAEVIEEDAHGRVVAQCFLPDGTDLSAEMVKRGLALDWPKFSGGKYKHMETSDARKKLWLASARQKGHMHVWAKFEARQYRQASK